MFPFLPLQCNTASQFVGPADDDWVRRLLDCFQQLPMLKQNHIGQHMARLWNDNGDAAAVKELCDSQTPDTVLLVLFLLGIDGVDIIVHLDAVLHYEFIDSNAASDNCDAAYRGRVTAWETSAGTHLLHRQRSRYLRSSFASLGWKNGCASF